jgi:hypothetical protein
MNIYLFSTVGDILQAPSRFIEQAAKIPRGFLTEYAILLELALYQSHDGRRLFRPHRGMHERLETFYR